jgi:hypothetical protein
MCAAAARRYVFAATTRRERKMREDVTTLTAAEVTVEPLQAPLATPGFVWWDSDPSDPVHRAPYDDTTDDTI